MRRDFAGFVVGVAVSVSSSNDSTVVMANSLKIKSRKAFKFNFLFEKYYFWGFFDFLFL